MIWAAARLTPASASPVQPSAQRVPSAAEPGSLKGRVRDAVSSPACVALRCDSAATLRPRGPVASLPSDPAPLSNRTSADSRVCHGPSYLRIHARARHSKQSDEQRAAGNEQRATLRRRSGRRRPVRVSRKRTPPPTTRGVGGSWVIAHAGQPAAGAAGCTPSRRKLRLQCRSALMALAACEGPSLLFAGFRRVVIIFVDARRAGPWFEQICESKYTLWVLLSARIATAPPGCPLQCTCLYRLDNA